MKKYTLKSIITVLSLGLLLSACGHSDKEEASQASTAPATASSVASQKEVSQQSTSSDSTKQENPTTGAEQTSAVNQGPIMEFTAYGAQPSWRAVIKDEQLSLEGEGLEEGSYTVERSAYAKGVEYFGRTATHEFSLGIRSQDCHDTAGQKTPFTVSFTYGKKVLKGCAVAGAFEQAGD